jgi:hypothetical protein
MIILFTQKFVISNKKKGASDPGSSKNLSRIPGQKGTGSRIRIRNTVILENRNDNIQRYRRGKKQEDQRAGVRRRN